MAYTYALFRIHELSRRDNNSCSDWWDISLYCRLIYRRDGVLGRRRSVRVLLVRLRPHYRSAPFTYVLLTEDLIDFNNYFSKYRLNPNPATTEACAFQLNNKNIREQLNI